MKRLTIGLLALGFCSAGLASGYVPPPPPVNYFDGFYLGIGAGLSHTVVDASAAAAELYLERDQWPVIYPTTLEADLGDLDGAADIFVGWGSSFGDNRNGYFGIELFGRYVPTSMSAKSAAAEISHNGEEVLTSVLDVNLSNDFSFGGDLRLGYLITPKVMIYALVGLDMADFEYKIHHVATDSTMPQGLDYSITPDTWQYGFMPGVGIEAMLSDNISVRAQYTYTYFGDGDKGTAETSISVPGAPGIASAAEGIAESIQRGVFTLDLTYHFKGV